MQLRRFVVLFSVLTSFVCVLPDVRATDEKPLSATEFLRRARMPFRQSAWGRFSGELLYRGQDRQIKKPIQCALLFEESSLCAEVVLDGNQVYGVRQQYVDGPPKVLLILPEEEGEFGIYELGVEPEDLTFSVLYWNPVRENKPVSVRGEDCRVFDMVHPDKEDRARVYFSRKYYFPLRIEWFKNDAETPWRSVEFADFKKQNDLWFVKTVIFRGSDWKAKIGFRDGEMWLTEDAPVPDDLLCNPPDSGEKTPEDETQ